MLGKIKNFITNHFDFKVYPCTWFAIVAALAVIPCIMFLPEKFGYENGLLENMQMLALLIAFIMAIKSKVNKKFFYFVAMIILLIALREVNYGRTLFFPIPGTVNEYYTWKEIKYGWLAHWFVGAYMAYIGLYFIWNKVFITFWDYIRKIKFPVWNMLLLLTGMTLGMYAEKAAHNMVFEEITELLFYVSLTGIIYLYAFNKNFRLNQED